MIHFIRRLLGWKCCVEFTQWKTYQATYTRPHDNIVDKIVAGTECITFTKRWQERKCTICGKVQQRELQY